MTKSAFWPIHFQHHLYTYGFISPFLSGVFSSTAIHLNVDIVNNVEEILNDGHFLENHVLLDIRIGLKAHKQEVKLLHLVAAKNKVVFRSRIVSSYVINAHKKYFKGLPLPHK